MDQCDMEEAYRYMQSQDSPKDVYITRDLNMCSNCDAYNLYTDYPNGMIVCLSCGVVNDDQLIDESAEWNFGQEDAMYGKDPSRCGCPTNPLLEKSSMSTVIGKGGGNKYWLMRKIHQQNSMDYEERARWHVFEHITRVAEQANLPPSVINQAKYLYKNLSERKLSRGGVRKGLIACCIMQACKQCNVSRSVKEISIICDVDVSKINNASKIFDEVLHVDTEHTKSDDLVIRFCSGLQLPNKYQYKLMKKVSELSDALTKSKLLVGKTPSAVTSGMIYFCLKNDNIEYSKKDLAVKHGISVVTLNKIVAVIEQNQHVLLSKC